MIGHLERNGSRGRDRPESHQELGDVLDLGDEPSRLVVLVRGQDVGVVLEHRATAGGVDDDRVDLGRVERGQVPPGQLEGRLLDARVVMDRAAARPGRAGSRPRSRSPGGRGRSPRWSRGTWRRPRSPGTGRPAPASGPIGGRTSGNRPRDRTELRAASPASAGGSAAAAGSGRSARPSRARRAAAAAGPVPAPACTRPG